MLVVFSVWWVHLPWSTGRRPPFGARESVVQRGRRLAWNTVDGWLGACVGATLCVLLGAMPAFDAACAALVVGGATVAGGLELAPSSPTGLIPHAPH
ncbi:MAG: hypothetical protein ABIP94_21645 [Planctomycetota bacterium]